jgi:hypothetical protein
MNCFRLRELFMAEWDPIGVSEFPGAVDEYDGYIIHAYLMLMDDGASAEQIAGHLWWAATENMGLTPHEGLRARCDTTAKLLFAMKPEFEGE